VFSCFLVFVWASGEQKGAKKEVGAGDRILSREKGIASVYKVICDF
jgi:hypothetical protein